MIEASPINFYLNCLNFNVKNVQLFNVCSHIFLALFTYDSSSILRSAKIAIKLLIALNLTYSLSTLRVLTSDKRLIFKLLKMKIASRWLLQWSAIFFLEQPRHGQSNCLHFLTMWNCGQWTVDTLLAYKLYCYINCIIFTMFKGPRSMWIKDQAFYTSVTDGFETRNIWSAFRCWFNEYSGCRP